MNKNLKYVKYGCYMSNISMAVVGNLSPLLFLTFRSLYGISYSLLGLLVLINFFTQLIIDLIFSFFSHKFNISKTVKFMPVLTVSGLLIFSLWSFFFPESVYSGLLVGTIIFSASGGLAEVLISPVIAAIPAEDPEREMSKLHSIYAWGVVFVVVFSTVFIRIFGEEYWQYLALLFIIIPLLAFILFLRAEIPEMQTPEKVSGVLKLLKNKGLWLCVFAIFLGGASECTMAQWSSSYLEHALNIPKVWGDIFGVAFFSVMLGLGRSLYAKFGKRITPVLFAGSLGATICYFVSAVSANPFIGIAGCVLTGFCVSMLWPGSLIVASERFPAGGVFIFAMMAAGGDFGASVGPQLVGVITDLAMECTYIVNIAGNMGILSEQLGMKLGMVVGMLFPLTAIPVFAHIMRTEK